MPHLQAIALRANLVLGHDKIDELEIDPGLLMPGAPVEKLLEGLGVVRSPEELEALLAFPLALREGLRGVVYSAVTRTPRAPMTFAWAPGYDYEMTVWDAPGAAGSRGAITVFLRSRYPADRHPTTQSSSA